MLVITGVLAGSGVCGVRARAAGIPLREALAGIQWALIGGFLFAHLLKVLGEPDLFRELGIRALWSFPLGLSSVGGFLGGSVFLMLYLRSQQRPALLMLDAAAEGLVVGWIPGRLGCTLVQDHPGGLTAFPLALAYADGPRHDLGLYELLFSVGVLLPVMLLLRCHPRRPGIRVVALCLLYGPGRFLLDFLRATDLPGSNPRFWGLTVAQYGCGVLIVTGLVMLGRMRGGTPNPLGDLWQNGGAQSRVARR